MDDASPAPLLARAFRELMNAGRTYLDSDRLARGLIAERTRLESELLDIVDGERERIGAELHDDLGQLLSAVGLLATDLERTLVEHAAPEADTARKIRETVELAIDHTSRLARDLATVDLEGEKLIDTLGALAAQTRTLFGVSCRIATPGEAPSLEPPTAHHVYKIAQEAVTNAIKHGRPSAIEIALAYAASELVLTVQSDGEPFPDHVAAHDRMGLRYMRHRASVIGATLTIRSTGDRGTIVRCALPVAGRRLA